MSLMQQMGGNMGAMQPPADGPMVDTAEQIYISSLALLKMLKHGRAGVPLEVMGLMIGEYIDDYTVRVVDVFAMPQSGTGVSVESVDDVYQRDMLEMLKQTGRHEVVVGWYHSHPGFGCWLSGVDMGTQKSFEQLNPRCVAVVIDPIQSVRGKVVIDAFRLIDIQLAMMGLEPRQTTSNVGHLTKPSITALLHGLNRGYYSMAINYRKNELEQHMLMNLSKEKWVKGVKKDDYSERDSKNLKCANDMAKLAETYNKWVQEEMKKTRNEIVVSTVGKLNPKKHLEANVEELMTENILHSMSTAMNTYIFK